MEESPAGAPVPSLRGKLLRGTAWMVVSRWVTRLIGVVNTAVLARILIPDDFGIVAMCMIVVGLLDVLLTLGVESILLQQEEVTKEKWNTAWSIRILQGIVVTILILASTPLVVRYFGEPRIATVLPVLSLSVLFQSFENIGVIAFRRELDFRKDFIYLVLRKVVVVVVTISLAVMLRNHWALALGIVSGQALMMGLSYVLHPYRPRFTLVALPELWSLSKFMLLANIAWYVQGVVDEFVVGARYSTKQFGTYTVSSDVAELPTSQILLPMMRTLLPGFSRLQGDKRRLAASYLNVLGVSATIGLACGVGVALVAPYIVPLLLGPKWLDAIPLIELLAIYGAVRMVYGNIGSVMLAVGRYGPLARAAWVHAIVLAGTLFLAARYGDLQQFCMAKICCGFGFMVFWFVHLTRTLPISARDIVARLIRPFGAAGMMAAGVLLLRPFLPEGAVAGLACVVPLGAALFTASLLAMWRISGAPEGAESFVLGVLRTRVFARFGGNRGIE